MSSENGIALVAQGMLVKLTLAGRKTGGGRKRGITHFSKSSRRCLLKGFATLEYSGTCLFLTLTYGQAFPTPTEAKTHLDTLLKRVKRMFPDVSAYWRLEFQLRGAPHFHIIFFNLKFWDKRAIRKAWSDIIGSEYQDMSYRRPHRVGRDKRRQALKFRALRKFSPIMPYPRATRPPFTRIETCHSKKQAWSYISKYVAKLPPSDGGFNLVSYLTDQGAYVHPQTGEICSIGRYWGVHNRKCLPLGVVVEVVENWIQGDPGRKAYYDLRRAARRRYKQAGNAGGFFLFSVDSGKWIRYFLSLIYHHEETIYDQNTAIAGHTGINRLTGMV